MASRAEQPPPADARCATSLGRGLDAAVPDAVAEAMALLGAPATMAIIETTLIKTIMYITMSRTVRQSSGLNQGNGRPQDDLDHDLSRQAPQGRTDPVLADTGS